MQVSYKKLWKLLIDRNITPAELRRRVELSGCTMGKLKRDEPVTITILLKVANELQCDISEICEFKKIECDIERE